MVERLTHTEPNPIGGATLRTPDGSVILELAEVPFNPATELEKDIEEQRMIDHDTGYFGKTIEQLKEQG
jgi:hypothetical protein